MADDEKPKDDKGADDFSPAALAKMKEYREEAKRHREQAEKERQEREKLASDMDALHKKIKEREDADLAEQNKWKELYEKKATELSEIEKRAKEEVETVKKQTADELSKTRLGILKERVRSAFTRAGIIDDDLIDLVDIGSVTFEDGKFSGIKELVAKYKEDKPKWFGDTPTGKVNDDEIERPKPGGTGQPIDARKLSASEFAELEERLRRGRTAA